MLPPPPFNVVNAASVTGSLNVIAVPVAMLLPLNAVLPAASVIRLASAVFWPMSPLKLVTPLLFFEMTGQINQPFSVFIAVITSYLVSDKLSLSMYDTLGVIGSTFSVKQFKRSSAILGQSSTAPLSCPVFIGARNTDVIALSRSCK